MSQAYSFNQDMREVQAMAEALNNYVRGNRLYGSTAAGIFARMPAMTVGALLLRLRRLDVLRDHLIDSQKKTLDKAIDLYEFNRTEWAHHYQEKLLREAHSRIDAMKAFFYECGDSVRNCAGIYKPEIMRRTIVQEILREMEALNLSDAELAFKVSATDNRLRRYVEASDFQWAQVLKPCYPAAEFWWLYHCPPDLP